MSTILTPLKRHPVVSYFLLTFAISWGAIILAIGPGGLGHVTELPPATTGALYGAMLAGPMLAALLLTGIIDGKAGLRALMARMLRWRADVRWYAVALLTAPLLMSLPALLLMRRGPEFLPAFVTSDDGRGLLLSSVIAGIVVGFCEEIGWTGFAVPRLRARAGILVTGIIVGVVWGAWHFLLFWEQDTFAGAVPLALLVSRLFAWLPPYRVLMVHVFDRTQSGLVTALMHASLVASQFIIMPAALAGMDLVAWLLAWAGVLWLAVGVVTWWTGGRSAHASEGKRSV